MSLVSEDTPQKSDPQLGGMTLDQKLACILDEIEREKTPDRLLKLASELQAWTGMLALAGHEARRWEPKRLRYRLYSIPATLARRARRTVLHLAQQSPWAALMIDAVTRLQNLPAPAT